MLVSYKNDKYVNLIGKFFKNLRSGVFNIARLEIVSQMKVDEFKNYLKTACLIDI